MKKLFSILLAAALLLPVLAGCQSSAPQQDPAGTTAAIPPETTAPAPSVPETTAPTVEYITPEEAKAIALQDAGLKEADVRDLEVELDQDDGAVHYDVDFEKGEKDYDYDIDAVTGEILLVNKPAAAASAETTQKPASSGSSSSGSSSAKLTKAEAKAIALKHAGLKESEVRELEVELDRDDGTLHYDVDFEKDGYDYDYEIDAGSGKILKSRKERV